MHKVIELVVEALSEDARENSGFDAEGWGNFFQEDYKTSPNDVHLAFEAYRDIRNGETDLQSLIVKYASQS